jgi:glucose/arabinose dehydrogenase
MKTAIILSLLVGFSSTAVAQDSQRFRTESSEVIVETVAKGLNKPWSLAFLPDGNMLVTEKGGRLRPVSSEGVVGEAVKGLTGISTKGQGGLLDVALAPDFEQSRMIYLSYAEDRGGGLAGTSVMRGRLSADLATLENPQIVFRQEPAYSGGNHFGSRLVFDREGNLFITVGDRFDLREQAQNPGNLLGKVIHVRPDGSPALGNPALNAAGTRPEIWSIGHRNVQGAALHPVTGELWTAEHGARGGDEINIPAKGKNYGWPVISYGVNYDGSKIGEGTAKAGMEQPVFYWDPSIAPSGMTFYTGDKFPGWRGSILVGALKSTLVARLTTSGNKITGEERMLQGLRERIRDVRQGRDGYVYLLTDSAQGRVLRVRPVS